MLLLLALKAATSAGVLGDVAWKTQPAELSGDNTCNVKINGNTNGGAWGYTSDGRPVYEIPVDFLSFGLSEVFLFYDKDCDGKGRLPHRWFVSSTAPDLTKDDQLLDTCADKRIEGSWIGSGAYSVENFDWFPPGMQNGWQQLLPWFPETVNVDLEGCPSYSARAAYTYSYTKWERIASTGGNSNGNGMRVYCKRQQREDPCPTWPGCPCRNRRDPTTLSAEYVRDAMAVRQTCPPASAAATTPSAASTGAATGAVRMPPSLQWELAEIIFPLSAGAVYNLLFGDDSNIFWAAVYADREYTGVYIGGWQQQKRVSTITIPGKGFKKDTTFIIKDQQLVGGGGGGGVGEAGWEEGGSSSSSASAVLSILTTADAVCSTLFQSLVQYVIVATPPPSHAGGAAAEAAEAAETCVLKVTGGVEWYANVKRCLVKKKVEKTVKELFEEGANELPLLINKFFSDADNKNYTEKYTNTANATNTTFIVTAVGIDGVGTANTRMSATAVASAVVGALAVLGLVAAVVVTRVRKKKAAAATTRANADADVLVSPVFTDGGGDNDYK